MSKKDIIGIVFLTLIGIGVVVYGAYSPKGKEEVNKEKMTIVQVRSCEYVIMKVDGQYMMTHAGDCQGEAHRPPVRVRNESVLKPVNTGGR